jgi:signal transduction histidine kinase
MTHNYKKQVLLKPPILPAPRHYPLWGIFLGAFAGVFIGLPIARIIRNINDFADNKAPLDLHKAIISSFSLWPMILLYAVYGAGFGIMLGWIYQYLQRDRLRQESLHREFEIQVATLRHHYKNLALGLHGFSLRVKRKLNNLAEMMSQNIGVEYDEYQPLKEEIFKLQEDIGILENTAQRLADTLGHELLFLKAITSDFSTSEPQDIYRILIASIDDLLMLRFPEKPIKVEINGKPTKECQDSLEFPFQSYAVEIILQNILSNAMKLGDHILVRVAERPDRVIIEVEDNGPGLDMAKLRDLVGKPSDRRSSESTLLGLEVTLHLLTRIGGSLEVDSKLGQGATFFITLPKAPQR